MTPAIGVRGGASVFDGSWFTAGGRFMDRLHCLDNDPITAYSLIALDWIIVALYLRLCVFWARCYYAEIPKDRMQGLLLLAGVFALCAVSGYGLDSLMFWWPGYKLQIVFKLALMHLAMALSGFYLTDLASAFKAKRLLRQHTRRADALVEALAVKNAALQTAANMSPVAVAFVKAQPGLPYLAANEAWMKMWSIPGQSYQLVGRNHAGDVFEGIYDTMPEWENHHARAIQGERLRGTDTFMETEFSWALEPIISDGHVVAIAMVASVGVGDVNRTSEKLKATDVQRAELARGWEIIRSKLKRGDS